MKNENVNKLNGVLTILKYYTSPRHVAVIFYFPHMETLKVTEGSKFKEGSTIVEVKPKNVIRPPSGKGWNCNAARLSILKLHRRFSDV